VRRTRLAALCLVLITATAACGGGGGGGDGTETFEEEGFALTFEYPSSLEETSDVSYSSTAGGAAEDARALGLDDRNAIIVSRYGLNVAVTAENVDQVKPEADDLISGLAGTELSGKQVEISGLPGFEYEFDLEDPPEGRSRLFMLFDGKTEYTLNCQSTPDKRDELQAACRQAVDTLATTGD
jgi:hypothetical protein